MEKYILPAMIALLVSFSSRAQYVTIPDANFVNWLNVNGYSSALNGNLLDTTNSLVLNVQSLSLGNTGISDLTGIQYFKGLLDLECSQNNLTVINTLPANLRYLNCSYNQITAINYLPYTLDTLLCSDNQLSSINPEVAYLSYLDCSSNYRITGLPTLENITYLDCHNCGIAQLWDFGTQLQTLFCQYNGITYLWLPQSAVHVECYFNYLDTLQPNLPYNLIYLDCSDNGGMTQLPVLPPNLQQLEAGGDALTSLPALPASLLGLNCGSNFLHALPALPFGLTYLECGNNPLGGILPALPSTLQQLYCDNDSISNLPTLPAGLTNLNFQLNFVTNVPSLPASLQYLTLDFNNVTALPSLPANLVNLSCPHNQLTVLPALPATLTTLNCSYNQLTAMPAIPVAFYNTLLCQHNRLADFPALPANVYELDLDSNINLACLPQLTHVTTLSFNGTGVTCLPNYGNVGFSTPALNTIPLCGIFNPSGCEVYWNISGMAYYDAGANCTYSNTDPVQANVKVMLDSAGTLLQQVFTDTNGLYSFQTSPHGKYTVTVDTTSLPFSFHCPAGGVYTDSLSVADSLFYNNNFALMCRPGYDLGIQSIVNYTLTRPAGLFRLNIVAGDISALYGAHCGSGISGQVQLTYSGEITYHGPAAGALTPTSVVGNTITWAIADFATVNPRTAFNLIMQVDTLALASTACINMSITPTLGDYNQSNNTYSYCFPIVNSFDPNEKTVYPAQIDSAGEWLTYTIRFQNTGNAPAINIHVNDTLNSSLDPSSFQLIAYSSKNITQLFGNAVVFNFPNINLPDSASNPTGSIGYVQFKIKTRAPLTNGGVVSNRASVYFDYNPPVLTNTVSDSILDVPLCAATYDTIFPAICQGSTFNIGSNAYTQPGIYTDTLTNFHGCDSIVSVHLLVTQAPGAGFTANTSVCGNQSDTITYTGLFIGTPAFNWSFDGATIQSGTNDGPYILSWSTPGVKTITLTVTSNGCSSAPDTGYVTVGNTAPTATFTVNTPECAGSTGNVTYTGTAGNGAVFNWNFGSGQANTSSGPGPILVTWPQADTVNVILTVNDNGCISAADTEQVFVYPIPSSTFTIGSGTLCPNTPATITYTGGTTGNVIYNWNFNGGIIVTGTGQGPYQVSWPTGGQQSVSLMVSQYGCVSPSTTIPVTVNPAPVVTFTWDSLVAENYLTFGWPSDSSYIALWCSGWGSPQSFSMVGGSPAGGTYSGVGIDNNMFYPDSVYNLFWIQGVGYVPDTITYTLTDTNGCGGYAIDSILLNNCLGIRSIPTTNLFTLYPNPADDYTTLNFDAAYTGAIIMVKDITGRQLYQTQLTTSPQQIPTGNLPPGVFLVTMYSNGEVGARLLVKD